MPSDFSPSLVLGVPSIDREHEVLLANLNFLVEHPGGSESAEHIAEVLSRLTGQLIDHFSNEEAVMRDLGMSAHDIAKHMDAHLEIIEQITHLSIELMQRKVINGERVVAAVRGWVVDHLLEYDAVILQHRLG